MIVVTGGAGFIGSNLIAGLNEQGYRDIVIVDRLGTDSKWRNIAKRTFLDFVFPEDLPHWLEGRKADVVFHMGANSSTTAVDADEIVTTNFRASVHLWDWCSQTRTPLIYASSAATYGTGDGGFDDIGGEDSLTKLRPLNLYGWSKHAFDRRALSRRSEDSPPFWIGLKFFNVYGPNEYHKGDMQSLVAKNALSIRDGLPIKLFKSHRAGCADGEQLRDFVYVSDCVQVMLWLMKAQPKSGLYNLGTGEPRSFLDLMRATGAALGKQPKIEFCDMPEQIRTNYQYFTQAKMEKLLGAGYNFPFMSLEEGVANYVNGYLAAKDMYK